MALAGPRLDRPSAVGEEGRPRATSLWIATLVAVLLAFAVTFAAWRATVVVALALPTGLVVAGVALHSRPGFSAAFFGHLCFYPAACALVGFVPLVFLVTDRGFVTLGIVAAFLGLSATWADTVDRTNLKSTGIQTAGVYVVTTAVQMLLVTVGLGVVVAFGGLAAYFGAALDPAMSLLRLVNVLILVAVALRVAVWALPIRQLWPRSHRERASAALDQLGFWLSLSVVSGCVTAVGIGVATLSGALPALFARLPPLAVAVGLLTAQPVVWGLLALGGVAIFASVLAGVARLVTRRFDPRSARVLAALAAGGVFSIGVPALVYAMLPVGGGAGVLLAIVLSFLGPFVVLVVVGVWYALLALGVVPERAGGIALAAAGLVSLAIGAADAGLAAPYVLAPMAGAMLVWDLSTFGLGLTATLGHLPDTRRLEFFHGVVSGGVAVGAVVGLSLLVLALEWVFPGGAANAATVAALAALVLLWPLRG